jgi:xanthine dehydrogenase accessory factor
VIPEQLARIGAELTARREPFVTATVVRVQRPTSVNPGAVALVHADGMLDGFIGGVCAQHSVRLYSLKAIESGEPILLRILPDPEQDDPDAAPIDAGQEISSEDGSVTVRNPCLSGGAVEVFLEPALPAPRLLVVGDSPIVAAITKLGSELGLDVVPAADRRDPLVPAPGDLAMIVAAHGRDELESLRVGLEAGLPYVGLVASTKRGRAMLAELRDGGVPQELLDRVDTPAGIDIGAQTPSEIALSILARVVEARRAPRHAGHAHAPAEPSPLQVIAPGGAEAALSPATSSVKSAVDPICGMEIVVLSDTPSAERDGETHYFCCDGCQRAFVAQQAA